MMDTQTQPPPANHLPIPPIAVDIPTACKLTSLSRSTLYREMKDKNLPYRNIGRRRLITPKALDEFINPPPTNSPKD
jgi:excisionase family DNA binding protein